MLKPYILDCGAIAEAGLWANVSMAMKNMKNLTRLMSKKIRLNE